MNGPNSNGMDAAVRRIAIAAEALDPDNTERVRVLADVLDEYAPILANDTDARRNIGNATSPSIWPTLSHLWNLTSAAHTDPDPDDEPRLLSLCVSLARFTRNLVACEPSNQQRAFVNERAIRSLIYHYTSFNATQNPNSFPATRMLSQTLSNIITGNDALSQTLWSTYVNLPEEQLVLTRLFASPDARTVTSAFVLVLNCVHESTERAELLTRSPRGPRICLTMLDRIAALFEAEEASEEGRAFDIGYEVFERLVETGLVPDLYIRLSVEGEVVTPHQTTLLKLVDSYLFASQHAYEAALPRRPGAAGGSLFDVLTNAFLELSSYTQQSIQRAIASDGSSPAEPQQAEANPNVPPTFGASLGDISPLQNLDLLLPKVCEALVLVTQCLTTVALRAEEAVAARQGGESAQSQFVQASPKDVLVTAAASTGQGFVESLIETLRLVDAFVPRITYGRLVKRPPPPGSADTDTLAQEKPTAAAPDAGGARTPAEAAQDARTAQAFAHVKRDLVRLLGVLASENRAVQDRVRVCGGIPVVMNLCVVDDYNPYLREHAIFALRNLLFGNAESQAVVDAIKPVGKWDEQKVLRDLRGGEA